MVNVVRFVFVGLLVLGTAASVEAQVDLGDCGELGKDHWARQKPGGAPVYESFARTFRSVIAACPAFRLRAQHSRRNY